MEKEQDSIPIIVFILPYNFINYFLGLNQKLLSLRLSVNGFCGRNLKAKILENGKSNFFEIFDHLPKVSISIFKNVKTP